MMTFTFAGQSFEYVPADNERTVEVALGRAFLKQFPGAVEVGAVLPYWGQNSHRVIDPFDAYAGCERVDGESLDYTGLDVLSISTVEHMGRLEYGNTVADALKPVHFLQKAIQAEHYLITWAVGQRPDLDLYAKLNVPARLLRRTNHENEWAEVVSEGYWNAAYNAPFKHGNVIAVVTNAY